MRERWCFRDWSTSALRVYLVLFDKPIIRDLFAASIAEARAELVDRERVTSHIDEIARECGAYPVAPIREEN